VLAQEGLSVVTGHGRVWLGALFLVVALVRRRRLA
jgi:hypothetical protein